MSQYNAGELLQTWIKEEPTEFMLRSDSRAQRATNLEEEYDARR